MQYIFSNIEIKRNVKITLTFFYFFTLEHNIEIDNIFREKIIANLVTLLDKCTNRSKLISRKNADVVSK